MAEGDDRIAFEKIIALFKGKAITSFRRATKKSNVYNLFIVAWFGWNYVGIRVRVVES